MLLRKTIQQTKIFFQKTLQNLKSFLFGGYQKLPKTPPLKPFSSSNNNSKMQQLDQFYRDFSEHWDSDHDKVMKKKKKNVISAKARVKEEKDPSSQRFMKLRHQAVVNGKNDKRAKKEKIGSSHEGRIEEPSFQSGNGRNELAQKMKELEMMDVNDVDHVLDIEEVLHYYSHLKCPVYVDIVDKFFMDIYSEFFLLQPPVNVNNSMQRLSPL